MFFFKNGIYIWQKQLSLLVSLSFASTISLAADWTSFLKPLQNSCSDYLIDLDKIPKQYKSSIIKDYQWKKKIKFGSQYETYDVHTINLKQATAFGFPITKIETSSDNYSTNTFEVYFKDSNFLKLRPDFYYVINGKTKVSYPPKKEGVFRDEHTLTDNVQFKSDKYGYTITGYADKSLAFDEKNKRISCSISN